jgi:N-acetylneuraminic acid mutarotase
LKSEAGPGPRRDHSLAGHDGSGRLYLFGGRFQGQALDDAWVYDLASERWERLQPSGAAPPARFGHNAELSADGTEMLLFGGQAGASFFNDVWLLNLADTRWEKVDGGAAPAPRYGAGAAFDGTRGLLYVSHGFTDRGRFDDTWTFRTRQRSWDDASPPNGDARPLKRCLLRCGWDSTGEQLLLFGGQSNQAPFHGDLWAWEAKSRRWREIVAQPAPSARNLYASFLDQARGLFYVLGGASREGNLQDVWTFDLRAEQWTPLSPTGDAPAARSAHAAALLPQRRVAMVYGGTSGAEMEDVWLLELGG